MSHKSKIEKVAWTSPDMVRENVERLKDIFPERVTEGRVDFDRLKTTLGEDIDSRPERYSFTWAGKRDAVRILQTPTPATLIPDPKESVDFEKTKNIFIEGDNLEVLKLLYKSYFSRVKMIYIDPPYNTGNDFIYPDNYTDSLDTYLKLTGQKDGEGNVLTSNAETNGRYHSAWLTMMYPRLFLARQMLEENGLIFISINDNEIHNLRLLMNEIYGEENFVAQLIWNTEGHTDNQYDVKINHEYLVLYAKNAISTSLGHVVDPNTRRESNLWKGYAENSITKNGPGNPPCEVILPSGFPCKISQFNLDISCVSQNFYSDVKKFGYISREITRKYSVEYPIRKQKMSCENGKLKYPCTVFSGWANIDKLRTFIAGECKPLKEENGDIVYFYLSENGVIYYRKNRERARNILSVLRNLGTTEQMRSELENMGIIFQYPKPKQLIKYLIKIGTNESDLILDYFAGSATTAQAILELNRESNRNRRYIMVQLPEPTGRQDFKTISDVGKERIRCVIKKLKSEKQGKLDLKERTEPEDLGFRVFKLATSNYKHWKGVEVHDAAALEKQMEAFTDPLVDNWKAENVIWEVVIKEGFSLSSQVERITGIKGNAVYMVTDPEREQHFRISLDDKIKPETVKTLGLKKNDLFVCRDVALDDELAANLALQCRVKTI